MIFRVENAIITSMICFLVGCATTTDAPTTQLTTTASDPTSSEQTVYQPHQYSLQPTQHELHQEKLQKALQ